MNEMVQIRSVKQYFNEFIVEPLKEKSKVNQVDLIPIKQAILDAFRKEIFGQVVFKLGPESKTMSRDDIAKLEPVQNILQQAFRKWRRFCVVCSENGLGNFFQLEDLRDSLNDEKEDDPEETWYVNEGEEDVTGEVISNSPLAEPQDPVLFEEKHVPKEMYDGNARKELI